MWISWMILIMSMDSRYEKTAKENNTFFMSKVSFLEYFSIALPKCCKLYFIPNIIMVYPFSSCICQHRQLSNQETMFSMHLQFRILQFVYFSCGFVGIFDEDETKPTFKTNKKSNG